jgi:hypothetical protein
MGLIKLTGVPDDVHRRLKADAAAHGLTLTQWCIDKLSDTVHVVIPAKYVVAEALGGCKSCGGLNGLHQKGCKA